MTARLRTAALALFLLLLVVFALAPFQWMLVASLKPSDTQLIYGNPWWTWTPDWSNYAGLLTSEVFGRWMGNTAVVIAGTLAISLPASLLAAYALAYLRVPYSRSIVGVLFATYLLPQGLLFLPLVRMLSGVGLLNTPLALIVTYPGLIIPFGTWVLWTFFRELPSDLVDFARLEGARDLQILLQVILIPALPAIAAVALFAVAIVFNDYLYAFAFVSNPAGQTLVAAVGSTSVDIGDSGFVFAAILFGIAPLALFCAFFADTYARGLGSGILD
ncbi:MAG: carbohydrate ABC transporter permease [Candidatus Dormibacteraceae bacterium]